MKKEHFEVLLEDINRKFDLVLEGHEALRKEIRDTRDESNAKHDHTSFLIQTLSKKVDAVDAKVDALAAKVDAVDAKVDAVDAKVDAVAADLSAHRADTEEHHGIYRVKETPEDFG